MCVCAGAPLPASSACVWRRSQWRGAAQPVTSRGPHTAPIVRPADVCGATPHHLPLHSRWVGGVGPDGGGPPEYHLLSCQLLSGRRRHTDGENFQPQTLISSVWVGGSRRGGGLFVHFLNNKVSLREKQTKNYRSFSTFLFGASVKKNKNQTKTEKVCIHFISSGTFRKGGVNGGSLRRNHWTDGSARN